MLDYQHQHQGAGYLIRGLTLIEQDMGLGPERACKCIITCLFITFAPAAVPEDSGQVTEIEIPNYNSNIYNQIKHNTEIYKHTPNESYLISLSINNITIEHLLEVLYIELLPENN